jgi:S-disulfanyl-L-cysteine oxidoreductase SoxD
MRLVALTFTLLCAAVSTAAAQAPVFSAEQVARGKDSYIQRCGICHGENLDDGDFGGAPLRGSWFRDHWGSGSVASLFSYVKTTMPPDNPGGLNDTTYADILSYILQRNGYAAGADELKPDEQAMEAMSLKK